MVFAAPNYLFRLISPTLHLLNSRSVDIRQGARKIIIQLARVLGPGHMRFFVQEMHQTMTKGYQVHVMMFTVHSLVAAFEEDMKTGDIDSCLKDLLGVRSHLFTLPYAASLF